MISNLRRMAIIDWSVILLTWGAVWAASASMLFNDQIMASLHSIAVLVIAGRFHALGVILHDAAHSRLNPRDFDLLFKVLCAYPIATTLEAMKYHHIRHHRFYGTDLDPYLKRDLKSSSRTLSLTKSFLITLLKASVLVPVWIARPIVALASLKSLKLKVFYQRALLQDRARELCETDELQDCLKAEIGQLLFWMVLLLVVSGLILYSIVEPTTVFQFYFFPLWLAGFVNVWRVLLEHDHSYRRLPEQSQDPGELWTTTKTLSVPGFDWFFAPRNIGYHQAHHLYPAVGLQDLPGLHRRLFFVRKDDVVRDPMTSVPVAKSSN